MFKLIIADDEIRIREGFRKIVDWSSLGFQVVGCYADGQQILDHLKQEPVDVVLTDIRMQHVGGMEVAQEIRDHYPHTMCVLVSAYQEFEFAHQAISLGVTDYLFKPTRIAEIRRVFTDIARRLEHEAEILEMEDDRQRRYEEMNELWRCQLLYDLYMGILPKDESYLQQTCHFYPQFHECAVLLRIFSIEGMDDTGGLSEEIADVIRRMFHGETEGIIYDLMTLDGGEAAVTAVVERERMEEMGRILDAKLSELACQAGELTGIRLAFIRKEQFSSLTAFAQRPRRPLKTSELASAEQLDQFSVQEIISCQRLMLSYLTAGDREKALTLSEEMVHQMERLSLDMQKNLTMDIMSRLQTKLQEMDLLPFTLPRYDQLWAARDSAGVSEWMKEQITRILGSLPGENNMQKVIGQLKNYIQEHYMEPISLDQAAEYVFLSPVYISRMFKQETGENFTDYLTSMRMRAARALLMRPDIRVCDVGVRTGYPNPRYFYRVFKRMNGLTPGEYRRQYVSEDNEED